ncbi:MAG TPA: hypothetical protein VLR94_00875 [Acidobacteriota bacterium]|nr:hypothetical protein [Acidobacteriota bacterium]
MSRTIGTIITTFLFLLSCLPGFAVEGPLKESIARLETELTAKYGEAQQARITRGLTQVAGCWRAEDGDAAAFEGFVRKNFIADQKALDETFTRLEAVLEQLDGHMLEIQRYFREPVDLDRGPILAVDETLAGYDPAAHASDDFFENKLAFQVLLNFPLTSLDERLAGGSWSRRQWAEARLARRFSTRIPGGVNLEISKAASDADRYISEYNIWMHHLMDDQGKRLFAPKLRLISHWNLRDELKADYSDPQMGLARQRMIQKVMERIVTQTIPAVVVNNPNVDWNPFSNEVKPATEKDSDLPAAQDMKINSDPEPDTRYAILLEVFHAVRKADPYSPQAATLIDRRFSEDREIPEARVKAMLEQVLTSPLASGTAALIQSRLGRPLEPFDIWYNGFRPRGKYTEKELDSIVATKYPTAEAFAADIPNILQKLGFSRERAEMLATNIVVDPSRGAGHAMPAARREDKVHLRTRVEKDGMNYKGYNIAIHEMGHNVEQIFSLKMIDHSLLQGVPNTAFTEALAFLFQSRDLDLLGLAKPDVESEALRTLNDYWTTYELSGVALVDMGVWHWMYDHPDATPAQLRDATVQISKDVWNTYYAPVFQQKDVVLLGIYSHMIDSMLYLPDYPIGHMIASQIEEQISKSGSLGTEFERMTRMGSVVPDVWMTNATGSPVGPEALLRNTEKALGQLKQKNP